jgi:hypothetical protein
MKLTKKQLMLLKHSRANKGNRPSLQQLIRNAWKRYLVIFGVSIGGAIFFWWVGWPLASLFFVGFLAGVLFTEYRWIKSFEVFWPISQEITNWKRAEQIINENEYRAT